MAALLQRALHAGLKTLPDGDDVPQRIDLLVIGAAHRAGVRAAEEEELRVVRRLRDHAEQIVNVIGLLDLIQPRDEPGVGDLGIELLIGLRQRGELLRLRVDERDPRLTRDELAALFRRRALGVEVLVVVNVHRVRVGVPVPDEPLVGWILHDGALHLVRDLGGVLLGLLRHIAAREILLREIGQHPGDQNAEEKQKRDLKDDAAPVFSLVTVLFHGCLRYRPRSGCSLSS